MGTSHFSNSMASLYVRVKHEDVSNSFEIIQVGKKPVRPVKCILALMFHTQHHQFMHRATRLRGYITVRSGCCMKYENYISFKKNTSIKPKPKRKPDKLSIYLSINISIYQ